MEDSRWYGQVGRRSKELQDIVLQQNDSVYWKTIRRLLQCI
jgi:hypothetical protein